MLQVHPIESYRVEVAPLARPPGMRRYRATATRPDHPMITVTGYTAHEVLMRIGHRIYDDEGAQPERALPERALPETAKPRKAKAGRKTGRKTGKKTGTRGADGHVSTNGLPPFTDLSNPVYFARGRFWIKTPDGSKAPYVPMRRSTP